MVAIIPMEMYERLIAEREVCFQVLDRIRGRLPDVPPEEVERDVAEAVAAVRAGDAEHCACHQRPGCQPAGPGGASGAD